MAWLAHGHQIVIVVGAPVHTVNDVVSSESLYLTTPEPFAVLVACLTFPARTNDGTPRDRPPTA
ncbi:hypothetical protein A4G30_16185 [Mycobacterium kansasii]|nr:hypothetical protein A4G30_16185 [Mycobacterium kansasii]